MPCAYAHYRLGQEVLPALPRDIREGIQPFKELYDIGLHGPDILFYHSPLVPDRVTKLGHALHEVSGAKVFSKFSEIATAHEDAPLYTAYLYGYLCHFALDCMCHGYVNRYAADRGISHNEIEMEFDRMLEVSDGHDPLRHDTAAHIIPSRRNCAVIASYYPGLTVRDINRSLRSMTVTLHTLLAPVMVTRRALLTGMRATGHYKDLSGLVMSLEPNPACAESTRRLQELYRLAVPLAIKLIQEYPRVSLGKQDPDRHLALNFLSQRPDT